jgi:hypothetical protein
MTAEAFEVANTSALFNYGMSKVHFPASLPVESHIRLTGRLNDLTPTARAWISALRLRRGTVGSRQRWARPCCW